MKKFLTFTIAAMFFFVSYGAECQKLEFENVYRDGTVYFANAVGNAAGDPNIKDILQIEFWNSSGEALTKLEVGTTILTDRESCDTCLILYEDKGQKLYSQTSGTFNITKVKEGTLESQGNASFRLVEVDDYFTPIAGGNCYDVENMTWDTICIPDCTGKVCGSDGCSSVCGTCGKNEGCSLDQSQCQPLDLSDCIGISIDFGTLKKYYSNSFYTSMDGGRPYVYMTFFLPENETKIKPGTYDLGSDKNLNYDTCSESVRLYSSYDSGLEDYTKMYFQHGGTIIVESVGDKNAIKGTITAKLVEADIAEDNSTTFFAGTKCLEIETSAFDVANSHDPTDPAEPTDCTGHGECSSNADCDPGYYCGSDCWCYIANPDEPDTSDSGSHDTGDSDVSDSGSGDSSVSDTDSSDSGSSDSSDSGSNNSGSSDNTDSDTSSETASDDTADDGSTDSKGSDGCSALMI